MTLDCKRFQHELCFHPSWTSMYGILEFECVSPPDLGSFQPLFIQIIFLPSPPPPSGTSTMHILVYLVFFTLLFASLLFLFFLLGNYKWPILDFTRSFIWSNLLNFSGEFLNSAISVAHYFFIFSLLMLLLCSCIGFSSLLTIFRLSWGVR